MDLSDDDSEASGPTTSEVLLFLTLPASAAPLSSSLMPRRHRERILEITKTVTVTEVVNNSAQCHPGTCEVTVTNIDSGSGHPVSVNISHLHETVCQENGSGRCSPVVHVRESVEEEPPAESVEEITQRIERILRVETEGDVTFKQRGDNVIDLNFTTPVQTGGHPEISKPDKTLYYHSFKKETAKEAAYDLISPDSAVAESPKRYIRSDDSDSDSGSMIVHSPVARPDSGVSSSTNRDLNGKNLSISVGSSEEDDLRYQGTSEPEQIHKNDSLPYYVITSMSETVSSQQSPNTTTFFADLDTSGTTTTAMNDPTELEIRPRYQKRASATEEKEKRRSILVVTNVSSTPAEDRTINGSYDSLVADMSDFPADRRRRITMEVLFTPPTPKENGAPPKPPRRAKYGATQLVEHVQQYECSLDEMSDGPNMTSTPISTLDRHARKSTEQGGNQVGKVEDDERKNETPILSPRKISKPPALKSLQPHTPDQPLASPRRSPSSPIIVVDQERRNSMDLLVPPKQPRRKSTITDIDWFAAFQMKEPTTPKSPRSPMAVDALREVENAMAETRKSRPLSIETKPLTPSKIDLDDIFACTSSTKNDQADCPCNACKLIKMSDEELKMRFNSLRRSPPTAKRQIVTRSLSHEERRRKALYVESDISLENVFAPTITKTPEESQLSDFYANGPAKERNTSAVLSTNSHTVYHSVSEFSSSDTELKSANNSVPISHAVPAHDISLDDIFLPMASLQPQEQLDAIVSHRKVSNSYEVVNARSSSPRASVQLDVNNQHFGRSGKGHASSETELINAAETTGEQPELTLEQFCDISMDEGFTSLHSTSSAVNQSSYLEQPRKSSENEVTKFAIKLSRPTEKLERPGDYVDSDISLDDVFSARATSSTVAHSAEDVAVIPAPESPCTNPGREQLQQTTGVINLEEVFPSQEVEQITVKMVDVCPATESTELAKISEHIKQAPSRARQNDSRTEDTVDTDMKTPGTLPQDVSWLEELLTPNLQPNEEELHDIVKKLHDEVIPSDPEHKTHEDVLNDSAESGYRSIDRSKHVGSAHHDISPSDNQIDLDAVFSPIRSDNHPDDKISVADNVSTRKRDMKTEGAFPATEINLESIFIPSCELNTRTTAIAERRPLSDQDHVIPSEEYRPENDFRPISSESRRESVSELRSASLPIDIREVAIPSSRPVDHREEIAGTAELTNEGHVIDSDEYTIFTTSNRPIDVDSVQIPKTTQCDLTWIESILHSECNGKTAENNHTGIQVRSDAEILTAVPTNTVHEEVQKEMHTDPSCSKQICKTAVDYSWIQELIKDTKFSVVKHVDDNGELPRSLESPPPVEDILTLVSGSPCQSAEERKKCTCSACKLTKLNKEELTEFWRRIKETHGDVIPETERNGTSTVISSDEKSQVIEATINLEEVFYGTSDQEQEVREEEKRSRHVSRICTAEEPDVGQKEEDHRSLPLSDASAVINLDDVFLSTTYTSDQKLIVTLATTDTLKSGQQAVEKRDTVKDKMQDTCGDVIAVPQRTEALKLEVVDSGTTEDSWIRDVIQSAAHELEEADTFEASYLQSIKEIERQNDDDTSKYSNYYRIEAAIPEKPHVRKHVDEYYDEPDEDEENIEDIDVGEMVDDILSSSMNEAVFRVATKSYERQDSHRTDTSADKKIDHHQQQQMFLSTIANDNRMESILSYPPSTSSPTTPHSTHTGENFVSEASMLLSEAPDDDYIIRLVFASQKDEDKPLLVASASQAVVTESELVTPSDSVANFTSYETTKEVRMVQQELPPWSQRGMGKTDEEVLEVEVSQESFIIKGSYSIIINKHDPLGVLLSELQSGSTALDFSVTPKIRRLLMQCLTKKAKPNTGKELSSRARELMLRTDPAYEVFYKMYADRYTKENQKGNINLCTAENNLCNELVEERFRQHPELFVPDYDHIVHYGPPGGHPDIKSRLSVYLSDEHRTEVDPSRMILLSSGNATYDLLCHCLFDSDDVILTNTPTYSRNFVNVSDRAQCHLAPIEFDLNNPRIDVSAYERVYVDRTEKGENVRAVIVINPHNPMGIVFSPDELKDLAHWAHERGLWLLVDESFSQCVHDPNTEFKSFLSLQMSLPVKSAWFWSLSKDFGLPGIRLSMVTTNNRDLHYALGQLELTEPVSSLAQDFVSNFLSDKQWLATFKEEKLKRIRAHYKFVTENLDNLGIPYQRATAGIFVFVDFSKKLSAMTDEAENAFFQELSAKGIFMTPGSHTKCPQPGWMRLVFACEKDQLIEAFRRFYEFFGSRSSVVGDISY